MIQFYIIQQFWPHNQCSPTHKVIALGLAQFTQLLHCGGGGTQCFRYKGNLTVLARVPLILE